MPMNFTVSVQMHGSANATPAMRILANDAEGAWQVTQQIVTTLWASACRPEGAEFAASICDPDTFEIHHFQNFEDLDDDQ